MEADRFTHLTQASGGVNGKIGTQAGRLAPRILEPVRYTASGSIQRQCAEEHGLVPLGAAGISAVCLLLAEPGLSLWAALIRLALLGFAGGFFIVPVCALLQHRPDKSKKGEVLAAANLLSFVGVFLASGVHYLLAELAHWSPGQIFLFTSTLTLAGAVYVVLLLPDSLLRFVLWALTRTIYRIHIVGRDNIPAKGGALFVCNHVSFVDALLLMASTDRQVRFMIFKDYYELPYFKPFARILGMIPISSEQRPRELIKSLRTARDAIRAGDVVCIFAEGQITRIGHLMPFRRGFERIMKDVDAPIIPVALDGVWGSIFSFHRGRFLWKIPRRLPYPVTLNYGSPLPGISVRIVEPETMTPVPPRQPGLMLVQGPNVMQGYLGLPAKTSEVLVSDSADVPRSVPAAGNKWYVTGDIAAIDEDGFLQITDRLSRFSKIGGEMVPRGKVEEKLQEAAGVTEQIFVVTGVKDEKKGEQLVVLHMLDDEPLRICLKKLAQSDLPGLWKPRADRFLRVDSFPYLGSGKLDLRWIQEMAEQVSVHKSYKAQSGGI
jgi:1-acyl-sn-glycerol-3-phosphate acyltransferase